MTTIEDFNEQENCILLIGNIPWHIKTSQITESLTIYSSNETKIIPKVSVLVDKSTGKSKGYSIVRYPDPALAKLAFEKFSNTELFDVEVFIRFVNVEHVKNLFYYNFGDTRINRNTPNIRYINSLRPYFLVPLSKEAAEHKENKVYFDNDNDRTLHDSLKMQKELKDKENTAKKAKVVPTNKPLETPQENKNIENKNISEYSHMDRKKQRQRQGSDNNYNKYKGNDNEDRFNKDQSKNKYKRYYENNNHEDDYRNDNDHNYSNYNRRSNRDNWRSHNRDYQNDYGNENGRRRH
eukprot:GAHX01001467.1.p1 GENE.GAHX01001467.1~~GAHX01001467.1.p1  ORF type:complete len:305 (-),score=55.62 GAHX01001467.1:622-1503(-)